MSSTAAHREGSPHDSEAPHEGAHHGDRPSVRRAPLYGAPLIALLLATTSFAQQPSLRLTLADAQARALDASHRLAEARARESVAQAAVSARAAMDRPLLGATANYTRTNHVVEFSFPGPGGVPRVVYPDVPNNYASRLDLQWPIYTGGRDALERAARAEAAAVGAELATARADLQLEVARAFWALVTARASVSVLQQAVTRAESHGRDVQERFDAGLVAPNETASAQAQLSRTRMLLIEATNQREAVSADLARLIGVDLSMVIEPDGPLESLVGIDAPASASLVAQAQGARPERLAMTRRIDAAEAQRDAVAASRRPTLALTGGVDYARPNARIFPRADVWDESWDAGVRLSWSLWDGGRTEAELAQAAGTAVAARERLAEFDSLLALEVRVRALDIVSGRAVVQAAGDAVRAAEEARRVVSERYRAGVIAQGDVLDADMALLQAELDRTRAQAGVRLAEARLARALGR